MNNTYTFSATPKSYANPMLATQAHTKCSDKYRFVDSYHLSQLLQSHGWLFTAQKNARSKKYAGFQKHLMMFHNETFASNGLNVRLFARNSHCGSSAVVFYLGFFRLCCENQLIADNILFEAKIRHSGNAEEQVYQLVAEINEKIQPLLSVVNRMKETNMQQAEAYELARRVIRQVPTLAEKDIRPEQLLSVRRQEDLHTDVFTLMNVIQENVMRGGLSYIVKPSIFARIMSFVTRQPVKVKVAKTRAVRSIDNDIRWNQMIWREAERMAA